MATALICREFGWTWQEYQEQPAIFIRTIVLMLKEEGAASADARAKSERQSK